MSDKPQRREAVGNDRVGHQASCQQAHGAPRVAGGVHVTERAHVRGDLVTVRRRVRGDFCAYVHLEGVGEGRERVGGGAEAAVFC